MDTTLCQSSASCTQARFPQADDQPGCLQASDKLNGQWKLVYTFSSELIPLLAASRLPFIEIGDIMQTIDTTLMTVDNTVVVTGPFARQTVCARAQLEVRSPKRLSVRGACTLSLQVTSKVKSERTKGPSIIPLNCDRGCRGWLGSVPHDPGEPWSGMGCPTCHLQPVAVHCRWPCFWPCTDVPSMPLPVNAVQHASLLVLVCPCLAKHAICC